LLPILKKELKLYFASMSGYVFIAFFVFITGLYFVLINIFQGYLDYQYVISDTAIVFLIIIPLLTMRLFSEEAKNKTDQLIFTAPVSMTRIVLEKYFAALILFLIAMLISMIFPAVLSLYGKLPIAQITGTYVGYFLLGACFISVGIFISALSENQIAVAISTFGIIFLFYILDSLAYGLPTGKNSSAVFIFLIFILLAKFIYDQTRIFFVAVFLFVLLSVFLICAYIFNFSILDSAMYKILSWFSLMSRFNNFSGGILNFADIIYYISFVILFLCLTISRRKY